MSNPLDQDISNLNQQKQNIKTQIRYLYIERGAAIQRIQQYKGRNEPEIAPMLDVLYQQLNTLDRSIQLLEVQGAKIDNEIERITYFRNLYENSKCR